MVEPKDRIKLLDSFRAISILGVLLFHFFTRYTPPTNAVSLYPYNSKYDFFGLGALGVRFFFIISGFVIFFTLEKTSSFSAFWKKRFIRLFPSMVVASIVTLVVFRIFDNNIIFPQSHRLINFLPSLSFLNPALINTVYHKPIAYIDASYWSLWPEVQFYLFSSLMFYIDRKNFVRNFAVLSVFIICLNQLMPDSIGNYSLKIPMPEIFRIYYRILFTRLFNLIEYLPFFGSGVIFYLLYKNNKDGARTANYIKLCLAFFVTFIIFNETALSVQATYFLMALLFFCFIYYPRALWFLDNKLMYSIGIASYFLYLIHQNIGVLFINKVGGYFLPYGFILTLGVICVEVFVSIWYTGKVERRIGAYLKKRGLLADKFKPGPSAGHVEPGMPVKLK